MLRGATLPRRCRGNSEAQRPRLSHACCRPRSRARRATLGLAPRGGDVENACGVSCRAYYPTRGSGPLSEMAEDALGNVGNHLDVPGRPALVTARSRFIARSFFPVHDPEQVRQLDPERLGDLLQPGQRRDHSAALKPAHRWGPRLARLSDRSDKGTLRSVVTCLAERVAVIRPGPRSRHGRGDVEWLRSSGCSS